MRINTNVASLNAQESSANTNKAQTSSLEKLSSGLRINKAADDASGLAIADKLRTQASSMAQGISNANSGSAMIQIADKAMAEQSNILDTVKTKLIQAGTSTTSEDGREAIRKDISKLLEQFDNIASTTNYNGTTLLQQNSEDTAKADTFTFQLGEKSDIDVNMTQGIASNSDKLGGGQSGFGAQSINSSVAAADVATANSIGGSQYGIGKQTDNNIGSFGAQQINTSGSVSINNVSIDATTGLEAMDDTALDFTISGDVGKVVAEGDVAIDFSSETQEVKDAMLAIASESSTDSITINADGALSTTTVEIDLSNINFSAARLTTTGTSEAVTLNSGNSTSAKTFTIENNIGQNTVDAGTARADVDTNAGQLNLHNASGYEMTGGHVLSDLKELQTGELTADLANDFMETIDTALTQLNGVRSDFGSTQNQLESSIRNMQTTHTNLKNAESVIRDVDYASESASFNKQNIIAQAGTYAMSQANSMAQNVQKLLQ